MDAIAENAKKGSVIQPVMTAFFIAWKHLTTDTKRWAISSTALGVATMLVLFTQGIVGWIHTSTTAYLDHTPASIIATATGVNDFLFSQAAIPESEVKQIAGLPGVASAVPILAINGSLSNKNEPLIGYVIGYPVDTAFGPWSLASGRTPKTDSEVVLDRGMAVTNGVRVGDHVSLIGHDATVVGLSSGTNAAGTFFAFLPITCAQSIAHARIASQIFIQPSPGVSSNSIIEQINELPGIHAVEKKVIQDNDQKMMDSGFAQPAQIMVVICLVVGLLVASIILYTATLEHARDLAVLKAIGATAKTLITISIIQSLILSLCGFVIGLILAEILRGSFYSFRPVIDSYITPQIISEILLLGIGINLLALILPARFLMHVDPQEVFKA